MRQRPCELHGNMPNSECAIIEIKISPPSPIHPLLNISGAIVRSISRNLTSRNFKQKENSYQRRVYMSNKTQSWRRHVIIKHTPTCRPTNPQSPSPCFQPHRRSRIPLAFTTPLTHSIFQYTYPSPSILACIILLQTATNEKLKSRREIGAQRVPRKVAARCSASRIIGWWFMRVLGGGVGCLVRLRDGVAV